MELVKAYSDTNAVKVIAFAISLEKELSSIEITELINRLKKNDILKEFTEHQIQHVVSMVISQGDIPKQNNGVGGIIFNQKDDNKVTWSLIANKDSVIVTCRDYSRWNQVSVQALEYIDIVFKELNNNIAQITLEYLDEFEILDSTSNWKESLFENMCEYITPNIYNLNDFWHISQGYFIKLEDIEEKILDTVDINYFADEDDNLKHKVNIRMQHKLRHNRAISYSQNNIKINFNKIHEHSKNLFFNIINDNILNQFNTGE
jgi:uncharacterized protein (TIGR04255 family)